jgi:hypothetical protein
MMSKVTSSPFMGQLTSAFGERPLCAQKRPFHKRSITGQSYSVFNSSIVLLVKLARALVEKSS